MAIQYDFTKRHDWVQHIMEGLQDFLHVLSANGIIVYVSQSCKSVTGYEPVRLLGRFIGEFLHPDDTVVFLQEFNASVLHSKRTRFIYRFRKIDGNWIILDSQCRPHVRLGLEQEDILYGNVERLDLVVMARPYLIKNSTLFDSFLGQTVEHERLTKLVEKLRQEESEANMVLDKSDESLQKLSDGTKFAAIQPSSNKDFYAKYRGSAPTETDTLVDLSYRNDDCVTTGIEGTDSIVIGDAGIPISRKRAIKTTPNRRRGKKGRVQDSHLCMSCGTFDSPEWRKGPMGPKTLCNACGLRWSKGLRVSDTTVERAAETNDRYYFSRITKR